MRSHPAQRTFNIIIITLCSLLLWIAYSSSDTHVGPQLCPCKSVRLNSYPNSMHKVVLNRLSESCATSIIIVLTITWAKNLICGAIIIIITHMQNCANSNKTPRHPKCLREKVFLWKANNYGCYTGNQVQHDCSEAWLCRECASPKTFGKLSSCPIHPNVFCSRYKLEKKFELEPVF